MMILLLLMMSCRTKTKVTETHKEESKTEIQSETKETKIDSTKTTKKEEESKIENVSKSLENQLIDIIATVEIDKPFAFTFKDGNAFKTFTVTGEAEVRFQSNSEQTTNKSEKSENRVQESKQLTASDYFQKVDSLAKSKKETKDSETKISKSGFQAGIYVWFGLLIIIGLAIYLTYRYFKK